MNYNKIREYCDQNGLSISDLAKKTKIPMASIYRHIQDKSMKVETLEKIANVLNHSNTTSTLRYLGITQEEVLQTYDDYEL